MLFQLREALSSSHQRQLRATAQQQQCSAHLFYALGAQRQRIH